MRKNIQKFKKKVTLKNKKCNKFSKKKTALKENSSFIFHSKLIHETKTSIFVAFCLLGMKECFN